MGKGIIDSYNLQPTGIHKFYYSHANQNKNYAFIYYDTSKKHGSINKN